VPLLLAAIISLLFWRALFRTHVLLRSVLHLTDGYPRYPLTKVRKLIKDRYWIRESNHYIAQWIPGVITISFIAAAIGTALKHWMCFSNVAVGVFVFSLAVTGLAVICWLDCIDTRNQFKLGETDAPPYVNCFFLLALAILAAALGIYCLSTLGVTVRCYTPYHRPI
jgi:hypothetical protein